MDTVKFKTDKTKHINMVAHRGVSGIERENTCPAFIVAGVKSYWGIETDVHVTRDGKYIIYHDDNLSRLLGIDEYIGNCDYEYLRSLRLLDTDNKTERGDLFLPSLDEYLSICKKHGKVAVLELKEDMSEANVCGIAKAVTDAAMFENTTFISFSKQNLIFLRKNFPTASAQFLSGNTDEDTVEFILSNNLDADIYCESIDKKFIDTMHEAGRVVNAWTVNTLQEAERLADIGIDMLTTNFLE